MKLITIALTVSCLLGAAMADVSAQIINDGELPKTLSGVFDRAVAVIRGQVEQRRYDTTGRWPTSEEFQPGDDLLLFLEWVPTQHVYMPLFGPDGSFKFEADGRTRAYGKSVVARGQARQWRDSVLAEVRKLRKP